MKNIALLLVTYFAWVGIVSAQVSVEVEMEHDQFLPNESVPVQVHVINNSGETLHFGQEQWLSYTVENRDGIILKTGDVPLAHDFDTKAGQTSTVRADLAPSFQINHTGRYTVTATVHLQNWNRDVASPPLHFDVVSGTKIWEQAFGVPHTAVNGGEPEVRKYILQQATLVRRMNLYFRLMDNNETRSFKIFSLGPMISFSNPQEQVDQLSRLHLFYQSNAHVYSYLVIDTDGDIVVRQTYFYANSAPHLKSDDAGNPVIIGGVRHPSDNDIPPSRKPIAINEVPSQSP